MQLKDIDIGTISSVTVWSAIGLPALWLFFKRVLMTSSATAANIEVITLMREEIGRVHVKNIELDNKLTALTLQMNGLMLERNNALQRIIDLEQELGLLCLHLRENGIDTEVSRRHHDNNADA